MTVIAYDPKTRTIACDSMFNNGSRKSYGQKFREIGKHKVALFAGDVRLGNRACTLLADGLPLTQEILIACNIVVFNTLTGACFEYERADKPKRVRKMDAWGTGSEFAIGALAAGATPEFAALVACTHSASCGGKVHVFTSRRGHANTG